MEQINTPLITIGMCCYNSADTVERAIAGALSQDWPHFELIVIDDGSSDDTPHVIQNAIKGHKNARFIQHEKNKTFPGALNTLIDNARGTFIAIFDDDDHSLPQRLSTQYRRITAYESQAGAPLVACWGSRRGIYPNGYEVHHRAIGAYDRPPQGTEIIDFLLCYEKKPGVFYGSGTPSCALMTRKSTYEAVGPYDETMRRSEDTDFAIRLGLKGGHFIGCPEELVQQYSTSAPDKRPAIVYDSYKTVMEKYRTYLESRKRFDYAMTWNKLRLHHFSGEPFHALGTLVTLFFKHPLLTWTHFWSTAPRRLVHEWKMKRQKPKAAS